MFLSHTNIRHLPDFLQAMCGGGGAQALYTGINDFPQHDDVSPKHQHRDEQQHSSRGPTVSAHGTVPGADVPPAGTRATHTVEGCLLDVTVPHLVRQLAGFFLYVYVCLFKHYLG